MRIVNLTQHPATQEQKDDGVFDLEGEDLEKLKNLLTFDSIPDCGEIGDRAYDIASMAYRALGCGLSPHNTGCAMIGGAPYLISALETCLDDIFITPLHSFTLRESVEKEIDGKVVKTSIFRHKGFVGLT